MSELAETTPLFVAGGRESRFKTSIFKLDHGENNTRWEVQDQYTSDGIAIVCSKLLSSPFPLFNECKEPAMQAQICRVRFSAKLTEKLEINGNIPNPKEIGLAVILRKDSNGVINENECGKIEAKITLNGEVVRFLLDSYARV